MNIVFMCKGCGRSGTDKATVHLKTLKGKMVKDRDCGDGYWRMVNIDQAFRLVYEKLAAQHRTLKTIGDSIAGVLDSCKEAVDDSQAPH